MGRASAAFSDSGRGEPSRRRRRRRFGFHLHRGHRSPSPSSSTEASAPEFAPPSSAASVSQQPPFGLPCPPDTGAGSYVAAAPLPVFRGDPGECPHDHLDRFDLVSRANGAATPAAAARVFPASLDADAMLWYNLVASGGEAEASPPPPWHDVRAAFLDFFRSPAAADRARAELRALRQRPGETVNRYHLRMQGILRRCLNGGLDVSEGELKDAFLDGLLAGLKDWVSPLQPETLDDAVALAGSWERTEGVQEAGRAACTAGDRCAFCGEEGHQEARCEVRRRMVELWRRRSSGGGGREGAAAPAKDGEEAAEGGGSARLVRLGSAVSTRSSQCQCRKHRCGKKAAAASEVAGGGDGDGSGGAADNKPDASKTGLSKISWIFK
ncbi:hypothetical protein ACP4OV_031525 [Aristida adscensionis]